jgi:hypothetical protein
MANINAGIMAANNEPYYCSQQIRIPPELPDILKQFTKSAIRHQPVDPLAWAASYFRAMANGEIPPVKERLEIPVATQKTDTGLTQGLLRVLHKQLGPKRVMPLPVIEEKWRALSLPIERFQELVRIGSFSGEVEWLKFFAAAASTLGSNITEAMKIVCEILTADPDGGAARISFEVFKTLYRFLASIDGKISDETQMAALDYLKRESERQEGMVMPRNFQHKNCPNLS